MAFIEIVTIQVPGSMHFARKVDLDQKLDRVNMPDLITGSFLPSENASEANQEDFQISSCSADQHCQMFFNDRRDGYRFTVTEGKPQRFKAQSLGINPATGRHGLP
jgi:hypothetical protein